MRFKLSSLRAVSAVAAFAALVAGPAASAAAIMPWPLHQQAFSAVPEFRLPPNDAVKITAYTVPTKGVNPYDIALGLGGNLYLTQPILNAGAGSSTYLWGVSESGHFSRGVPALGGTGPVGITRGPSGDVYFGLTHNGVQIGSYGGGAIRFTPVHGPGINAVYFLTRAADGSLWFSDPGTYHVGHIVGKNYTLYLAPTKYCSPYGITIGSDRNIWVAEQCPTGTGKIGRITPAGAWKEYTVPTPSEQPFGITAGPDGNLWYAGGFTNNIGRVTPGGAITEFSLNGIGMHFGTPYLITAGNDGALWFTVQTANMVGRITTRGAATEYPIPGCGSSCSVTPGGISAGLGRTIWFTNITGNQVDKLTY